MRRGLFTESFEPIVQIGDIVKLLPENIFGKGLWEIKYVSSQPVADVINLASKVTGGVIPALSETDLLEIDELKLPGSWLGQWRLFLKDDFVITEMRYKGKAGAAFWARKERISTLQSGVPGSWLTELFMWADDKLYVKAKNIYPWDMKKARVMVSGYIFKVEPYSGPMEEVKAYTRIPIGAMEVA